MKAKHLPRLWCALQGLLPLLVAGERPPGFPLPADRHAPTISRWPCLSSKSKSPRRHPGPSKPS